MFLPVPYLTPSHPAVTLRETARRFLSMCSDFELGRVEGLLFASNPKGRWVELHRAYSYMISNGGANSFPHLILLLSIPCLVMREKTQDALFCYAAMRGALLGSGGGTVLRIKTHGGVK